MGANGFFRVAGAIPRVKVGDCRHNARQIEGLMRQAVVQGVELVLFPELSLTGATCGDLFLQPQLWRGADEALTELLAATDELPLVAVVGMPISHGNRLYNCAVVIYEGRILCVVPKSHICSAEQSRWFTSGAHLREEFVYLCEGYVPMGTNRMIQVNGVECAIELGDERGVVVPPAVDLVRAGARVLLNPSATPDLAGHDAHLKAALEQQSARLGCAYLYASAGFGESSTDWVYGGRVLAVEAGELLAENERFSREEKLVVTDLDVEYLQAEQSRNTLRYCTTTAYEVEQEVVEFALEPSPLCRKVDPMPFIPHEESACRARCEELFQMQRNALAQRMLHTGCCKAVLGVSGGLDSTLALLVVVRLFDWLGLDRKEIYGITMPGFGTSGRTYQNALALMRELGITQHEISIVPAVKQHFLDIDFDEQERTATYENSQARERTQILMDYANKVGGLVIGTGDLSELALGWATYNGDHMSMYGVNGSVPKTLVRHLVRHAAQELGGEVARILLDVVDTPVSPELLPADQQGKIAQKTEDLVGPYELHDFVLYHFIRRHATPRKIFLLARVAFAEKYDDATILKWMSTLFRRFFSQQFKRSALPDGPKLGSVSLSPRGDWMMPSDASAALWLEEIESLKSELKN